ncbi:MAG TPA: SRPBCC domain-containing protein [Thermoplasmata archaeon]|nr:SRPBCC domain-containing protein [Thermoplasmata archaeon]
MLEELDPIIIQVTVPLPLAMIHGAFTDGGRAVKWMCDHARIEPVVGGAYELEWTGTPAFRSAGKVTRITPELDIGFSWFGPSEFDALMNRPEPLTSVYVRLQESPEGIDVTLEHQGWVSGPQWEEARSWHFQLWDDRLHRLKDYLLKEAYG